MLIALAVAHLVCASSQPAPPQSLCELVRVVSPTLVKLWFSEDEAVTGTIISKEGLVVTCAHIPANVGDTIPVSLITGKRLKGRVLSKLPEEGKSRAGKDIALVQLSSPGTFSVAKIGVSHDLTPSSDLVAIGFPDTGLLVTDPTLLPPYVRLGHPVNYPYRQNDDQLFTSMHGFGGDSGGPLFDRSGALVGICSGGEPSGAFLRYTRIEVLTKNWAKLAGKHPPLRGKKSPAMPSFRYPNLDRLTQRTRRSVVEIHSRNRWVTLGTVVDGGYVLTKASDLGPDLWAIIDQRFVGIAEVVATDPTCDLALLKLSFAPELLKDIPPIAFNARRSMSAGSLIGLVAPSPYESVEGIVCMPDREVPPLEGVLPIRVEDGEGGPIVADIETSLLTWRLRRNAVPLKVGDRIVSVAGTPITNRADYLNAVSSSDRLGIHPRVSGEPVPVVVRRGNQTLELKVVLEFARNPVGQLVYPSSNRYSGFPLAIVSDLEVRPEHSGAPVFDATGNAIGIVIGRAPMIETLVLPSSIVAKSIRQMKAAIK